MLIFVSCRTVWLWWICNVKIPHITKPGTLGTKPLYGYNRLEVITLSHKEEFHKCYTLAGKVMGAGKYIHSVFPKIHEQYSRLRGPQEYRTRVLCVIRAQPKQALFFLFFYALRILLWQILDAFLQHCVASIPCNFEFKYVFLSLSWASILNKNRANKNEDPVVLFQDLNHDLFISLLLITQFWSFVIS